MYSQYQQYQQQGQSFTNTQQNGYVVWNGSQWVQPQPQQSTLGSNHFSPQQHDSNGSYQQLQSVPQEPVQVFTNYYHSWNSRALSFEKQQLQQPGNTWVKQQAEWARWNSDQCSRLAHYFHQNPSSKQSPYELPYVPPPSGSDQSVVKTPAATEQQPAHKQHEKEEESPDSLKQFVHRCLLQCNSSEEKTAVMKKVERLIQEALQDGNLHSKDWSTVPIVRAEMLSPETSFAAVQQQVNSVVEVAATPAPKQRRWGPENNFLDKQGRATTVKSLQVSTPNDSYYGPASAGNYYGPKSTSGATSVKSKHQGKTKTHAKRSTGDYYGPSESSTNVSSYQQTNNSTVDSSEEDFVALPSNNKKRTFERKNSGFNQTSKVLHKRARRFAGPGGIADVSSSSNTVSGVDRYMGKGTIGGSLKQLDESDFEKMTVKGTCTILEKDYLRLTSPPRAELVRPQPILEQHLANLKQERERNDARDYIWFCSQLKAVRQDCTVQRIQNSFTVDVYETHARIALQEGDLNEFNQCQTQLKELYHLLKSDERAMQNQHEFLSYRLLYFVFLTGNKKYDGGSSDLFKTMLSLSIEQKENSSIQHALKVRVAVQETDYHAFFQLYKCCPHLGSYLMDHVAPSMRFAALQRMWRAYRPSLSVAFVLGELGFDTEELDQSGLEWMKSCGCILSGDLSEWNTKDSVLHESDLDKSGSLI